MAVIKKTRTASPYITRWQKTRQRLQKQTRRLTQRLNPTQVVIGLSALLVVLLIAGKLLRQPEDTDETPTPEPRVVETYSIGSGPRVTVQAQVEKGNVITIMAQTAGVVQKVNVQAGQAVRSGQNLLSLASNYQGGNAATVQRQIAGLQYQLTSDTYEDQKSLVAKQRAVAEQTEDNASELRAITEDSVDETKNLIDLNENLLDTIHDNLNDLEANNVNGQQDDLIFQTKQLQAQYQSGLNQLRASLRQAEYQVDDDNPPTELAQLQKDIALQQLAIQEKSLDVNKDLAALQLRLAKVSEGLMYPSAPKAATVERVHVRYGQMVNPGMPLVTLQTQGQATTLVALVSHPIAMALAQREPAFLQLDGQAVEVTASYVSQEAVQNGLYAITFTLPEEYEAQVSDGEVLAIDLPVSGADTGDSLPFIPLDAIYQNASNAYVFVVENNEARYRQIELGNVFGSYVEVLSGLNDADQVILDRHVIEGDPVTIEALSQDQPAQ